VLLVRRARGVTTRPNAPDSQLRTRLTGTHRTRPRDGLAQRSHTRTKAVQRGRGAQLPSPSFGDLTFPFPQAKGAWGQGASPVPAFIQVSSPSTKLRERGATAPPKPTGAWGHGAVSVQPSPTFWERGAKPALQFRLPPRFQFKPAPFSPPLAKWGQRFAQAKGAWGHGAASVQRLPKLRERGATAPPQFSLPPRFSSSQHLSPRRLPSGDTQCPRSHSVHKGAPRSPPSTSLQFKSSAFFLSARQVGTHAAHWQPRPTPSSQCFPSAHQAFGRRPLFGSAAAPSPTLGAHTFTPPFRGARQTVRFVL